MSIPKEPRQLMINLMYIVLTALLALNVSAEVMNAFFDLNKSLKKSISLSQQDSEDTWKGIQAALMSKKKIAVPINKSVQEVTQSVDSLVNFIQNLQDELIDLAGDNNGIQDQNDWLNDKPIGFKNKDVPTRVLVNQGKALVLKEKVIKLKKKLESIYSQTINDEAIVEARSLSEEDIKELELSLRANLALYIESEEEIQKKTKDGKPLSWEAYKFNQMPLVAVLPILSKIQNDAVSSKALLMARFAKLTGGKNLKLNNFFPVIVPEKSYVIEGEPFKAKVGIGAYSSEFSETSTVYVNGQKIKIGKDGWGDFLEPTNTSGPQKLRMKASVHNPHSKKDYEGFEDFTYEVGKRSASVSPTKMNLLYIGVENPLNISVAGSPSGSVRVECEGCEINKNGEQYIAKAKKPGRVKVFVSAEDFPKTPYEFRVKRIPDPLPKLGNGLNKHGGLIGNGEFKLYDRLEADLKDFVFDANCKIIGFNLSHEKKNDDVSTLQNKGSRYSEKVKRLVSKAKPGDNYYYDEIRAKCPGDVNGRKLPSIIFRIR